MEKIAIEYGDGLFELAAEQSIEQEILEEARALRTMLREDSAYIRLMTSRAISKDEKDRLLTEAFDGRVHPYLFNFLRLMNERDYFGYVPSCFSRYEECYYLKHNLKKVLITSAAPLQKAEKEKLEQAIEKKLGVRIEAGYRVDASLLAGLRIVADGVLIENSAKSRIEGLKKHLSAAVTDHGGI